MPDNPGALRAMSPDLRLALDGFRDLVSDRELSVLVGGPRPGACSSRHPGACTCATTSVAHASTTAPTRAPARARGEFDARKGQVPQAPGTCGSRRCSATARSSGCRSRTGSSSVRIATCRVTCSRIRVMAAASPRNGIELVTII